MIRTREGRFRPLTAFEAVPFVRSGTPPSPILAIALGPGPTRRSRRSTIAEERRSRSPHSSASTPDETSTRWFSRGSSTRLPSEPANPALGSAAPNTTRRIRASTMAPAHIAHGSSVTHQGVILQVPRARRGRGVAEREDLGVRRRVLEAFTAVAGGGDHLGVGVSHDHAPDRHITVLGAGARGLERRLHVPFVQGTFVQGLVWSILVGVDLEQPLVADPEVVGHLVGDRVANRGAQAVLVTTGFAPQRAREQRDLVGQHAGVVVPSRRQRDALVQAEQVPLAGGRFVVDRGSRRCRACRAPMRGANRRPRPRAP